MTIHAFTSFARRGLLGSWLLLVGLLVAWHATRLQATGAWVAIGITAGPWLALLPAVLRKNRQAHVLAAVLAAPTMGYALMELLTNRGAHAWAAATLFAAFCVFVFAGAWLRFSRPRSLP